MDYLTFFKGLAEKKVDYLLVGGLAVYFHGIPRMTYDIDIMILLERDNIISLVELLKGWGYRARVAEDPAHLADEGKRKKWSQDKGMRAFTFWCDDAVIHEVDVVFDSPISYEDLTQRAVNVALQGVDVPTISIQDLIDMKMQSERRQDISDVEHLRRLLDQ